jgi:hypothetical protein
LLEREKYSPASLKSRSNKNLNFESSNGIKLSELSTHSCLAMVLVQLDQTEDKVHLQSLVVDSIVHFFGHSSSVNFLLRLTDGINKLQFAAEFYSTVVHIKALFPQFLLLAANLFFIEYADTLRLLQDECFSHSEGDGFKQLPKMPIASYCSWQSVSIESAKSLSFNLRGNAVVGGTFDHLHEGHKLMLSAAALLSIDLLVCGISAGRLLVQKSFKEHLQEWTVRHDQVETFVSLFHAHLRVTVISVC